MVSLTVGFVSVWSTKDSMKGFPKPSGSSGDDSDEGVSLQPGLPCGPLRL